jgi:hypothetical protein
LITVPMVALIVSFVAWLLAHFIRTTEGTVELVAFIKDVSRILFAASVLVVLWGKMAERAF